MTAERRPGPDPRSAGELAKLGLAGQIARVREAAGLSQAELARRIGTKQAGIARIERTTYNSYTVGTLARIAAATGARLEVRLIPARGRRTRLGSSNGARPQGGQR